MRIKVQRWGNSLAIRLPAMITRDMNINSGSEVDLVSTDRGLLIRPAKTKCSVEQIIAKLDENQARHPETDWGSPVGRETW